MSLKQPTQIESHEEDAKGVELLLPSRLSSLGILRYRMAVSRRVQGLESVGEGCAGLPLRFRGILNFIRVSEFGYELLCLETSNLGLVSRWYRSRDAMVENQAAEAFTTKHGARF